MFRITEIEPETELEQRLLRDDELRAGLAWGKPRWGHPEGAVHAHVAAILAAIERDDPLRADLRVLALIHDSFKRMLRPSEAWSPDNDHAVLARRFAERYLDDERLLATLELHDEPYWLWRSSPDRDDALQRLLGSIPDRTLFARFVELDAASEGKDLSFLWWFRREMAKRGELPARVEVADTDDQLVNNEPKLFVKAFATTPGTQAEVGAALNALIAEHARALDATGEVLLSEDGLRALLVWRWHGRRDSLLQRDSDVIREALAAHPVLADADPVDARIYRALTLGTVTAAITKPA